MNEKVVYICIDLAFFSCLFLMINLINLVRSYFSASKPKGIDAKGKLPFIFVQMRAACRFILTGMEFERRFNARKSPFQLRYNAQVHLSVCVVAQMKTERTGRVVSRTIAR